MTTSISSDFENYTEILKSKIMKELRAACPELDSENGIIKFDIDWTINRPTIEYDGFSTQVTEKIIQVIENHDLKLKKEF